MAVTPTQPASSLPGPFFHRIIRAFMLDAEVYREVIPDRFATGQAAVVVCLAGLAQPMAQVFPNRALDWPLLMLVRVTLWFLLAFGVALVGRLAAERRPFREVLRPLGFADSPALFAFLLLGISGAAFLWTRLALTAWQLAATIQAARATFGVRPTRAALIVVAPFLLRLLVEVWLVFQFAQLHEYLYHQPFNGHPRHE